MARGKIAGFELKVQPRENLNSVPAEIPRDIGSNPIGATYFLYIRLRPNSRHPGCRSDWGYFIFSLAAAHPNPTDKFGTNLDA